MDRRHFSKTTLAATALLVLPRAATAQNGGSMKILVLTGSPRKNGNSNILANNFIKGARSRASSGAF